MSSKAKKLIKTCRLCTKSSEGGIAHDLFAICNKSLLREIKEITGIILRDMQRQNLPRHICSKCKEDLYCSYEFRSRVIKSQSYFKSKDYQRIFDNVSKESKQENSEHLFDTVFVPSYEGKLVKELDIKCSSDESVGYEDNNYIAATECVEAIIADTSKSADNAEDELKVFQSKNRKRLRKSILQNVQASSTSKMLDNVPVSIKIEQNDEIDIKLDLEDKNARQNIASTEFECVETSLTENKIEDTNLREYPIRPDSSISDDSTIEDNDDPEDPDIVFSEEQLQKKFFRNSEKENDSEDLKTNQFHCQLCEKSFKTNYLLNVHYCKEHKGEKKCKLCEQTFLTRKSLETHLRWHNGEEAYKCRFCDMTFKRCPTRYKHERKLHSRDCAFLCPLCGKTFTTSDMGKNHMVVHTKERAFHCTVCNTSFLRKTHLQTHYRSETHKNNEMRMKEKTPTVATGHLEFSSHQQCGIQDNIFSQIVHNSLEQNTLVSQLPPD